jgi:hypothetical protein
MQSFPDDLLYNIIKRIRGRLEFRGVPLHFFFCFPTESHIRFVEIENRKKQQPADRTQHFLSRYT